MAIPPEAIAAIGGLVSSIFGKKPSYDEPQRIMLDAARREAAYGKGIPGSDPQERAALAEQRGLLGQEQQQALGMVLGSLPANATTNTTDLLANLGGSFATQRGALDQQALLEWFNRRRQAMLSASQIAGGVGAPRKQGSNIADLMGQLAQLYAQREAMRKGGGGMGDADEGGGGGGNADELNLNTFNTALGGLKRGWKPSSGVQTALAPSLSLSAPALGGPGPTPLSPWRPSEQAPRAAYDIRHFTQGSSRNMMLRPSDSPTYDIEQFLQGPTLEPRRRR